MNAFILSHLLIGVTTLGLGVLVFSKNSRGSLNRLWLFFSLTVSFWALGATAIGLTRDADQALRLWKIVHVGVILIAPAFVHFAYEFVDVRERPYLGPMYLCSAGLIGLSLFTDDFIRQTTIMYGGIHYDAPPTPLYLVFMVGWSAAIIYAHWIIFSRYRTATPSKRAQIQYFTVATVLGFCADSTSFLPVFGVESWPQVSFLAPLFPIIMTYAMVRHRLMDIELVIKKTFIYSLLLLLLIAPCYAVLIQAEKIAEPYVRYPVLGCLFVLVAFVFPRIRIRTERSLENILFNRGMDYRQILAGFSKEITSHADLTGVLAATTDTIRRATDAHRADVYLLEDGRYQLARDPSSGAAPGHLVALLEQSADCLLRKALSSSKDPIAGLAQQEMKELSVTLAVPLLFERSLKGFILLSDKDSAGDYSSEEISFLRTVASQLAMAVENIRKHEEVDKLKELDTLKNALFSKVSHELRTPLTNILLPLQRVLFEQGDRLHPENRQEKEAMLSNGLKLLKRINEILDLSKLESGKMKLSTAPADLRAVLDEVVSAASPAAAAVHIELSFASLTAPPPVYVNVEQMEKVFANLVGNALKFTEAGGRVNVEIAEEQEGVVVTVSDTGRGIPEADLPFIFDRFRQVDGATSRMYEGTGLGLALVKELVELHRGRIDVESELGKGSSFRVWLRKGREHLTSEEVTEGAEEAPALDIAERRRGDRRRGDRRQGERRQADREDRQMLELLDVQFADLRPATLLEAEESALPGGEGGDGRRVLVVEDNRDLARNIAKALRHRFSVSIAYDGEEALGLLLQDWPDVVVSDVMMPRMDGFELCSRIRAEERGKRTPVVLLTAKSEVQDRIAGFRQGADHYLAKPFNASELLVVIDSLLSKYDLQRELEYANTELQKALQELAETQVQLVHSARLESVGELAAGVAHEVKNSIYCVRTGLSGIEKRIKKIHEGTLSLESSYPEIVQALGVNAQALDRSLFVVNSLLDFSRANRSRMAPGDLGKGIADTVAILEPRIRDKLELRTSCGVTAPVECKIEEINQIVMNLVLNAHEAIPERGNVSIRTEQADGFVEIRVSDDGPGIPEEHVEKIFLPFFTTKEKSGNSGLGLSIVHNIVKAHHGTVRVESEVGRGTCFTIRLPNKQPSSDGVAP
ncbi:MAG: response regulator [Deltaproteobacteria bacterium]|nr:response regulator [Deltaproteobacteria bacterium]